MNIKRFGAIRLLPALALLLALSGGAAGIAGQTVLAGSAFKMGVPITVNPIRGGGEPIIGVDLQGNPWISGPGGSSTQTSWFYHSLDGGLTYPQLGPAGGHWVCNSTGGGDSWVQIDKVNGDVYVMDQQALADLALGRTTGDGRNLSSACFADPALTADRGFITVVHPTTIPRAPQYATVGNKPVAYMTWQCNACAGTPSSPGGLAYAYSTDGTTWHPAEPGCAMDNLPGGQSCLASHTVTYQWHGNMVADPHTGYVFTALSCNTGGCDGGPAKISFGVTVGKPAADSALFKSINFQLASGNYNGASWPERGSLFPVTAMDAAGTLYLMWAVTNTSTSGTPAALSGHVYYAYSKDKPDHKVWSPAIRIDQGAATATGTFPWMAAGDAGKVAFLWLGTPTREYPSQQTASKQWWPFVATSTNGDTPNPTFQQSRVGTAPNHLGDICLMGTTCGATFPPGNRNMADFNSIDITPDGAAQITYAADSQQLGGPTSLVKGVPITMTARQSFGPRLIGDGDVNNPQFDSAPLAGVSDASGDALYPNVTGLPVPQMDLTGSSVEWTGSGFKIRVSATNLSNLSSPDSSRSHVWWLTTWRFGNTLYFAKAESIAGAPPLFTAGVPTSYDRPGLTYYTVPTLVDYRAGTPVIGKKDGNAFVIDVPAVAVGSPKVGSLLEGLASYTVIDNGNPPFVTAGPGNVPYVLDATPTFNHVLGATYGPPSTTPTNPPPVSGNGQLPATLTGVPAALALVLLALAVLLGLSSRRRPRASG